MHLLSYASSVPLDSSPDSQLLFLHVLENGIYLPYRHIHACSLSYGDRDVPERRREDEEEVSSDKPRNKSWAPIQLQIFQLFQ